MCVSVCVCVRVCASKCAAQLCLGQRRVAAYKTNKKSASAPNDNKNNKQQWLRQLEMEHGTGGVWLLFLIVYVCESVYAYVCVYLFAFANQAIIFSVLWRKPPKIKSEHTYETKVSAFMNSYLNSCFESCLVFLSVFYTAVGVVVVFNRHFLEFEQQTTFLAFGVRFNFQKIWKPATRWLFTIGIVVAAVVVAVNIH